MVYKLNFDFQDIPECFLFASQSASPSPWSVYPPGLPTFPVNNKKQNFEGNGDDDEEEEIEDDQMFVCLENLPPVEQKVRTLSKPLSTVSSSRVPLGNVSTNTLSAKPRTIVNILKPKSFLESSESASPKPPPAKKLRLSLSWSQ